MAEGGSFWIDSSVLHDEEFDYPCTMCSRKNKNTEAKHFCVDCNDNYCTACVKVHKEVPALSKHVIQWNKDFQKTSPQTNQGSETSPVSTEKCDVHRHNFIDMYCFDHDYVGCGTCIAVDHKQCRNTFYIPEYLKKKKKISTKESKKETTETLSHLKDYHENLERKRQNLLKNKVSALHSISVARKEINDRLDELEKNTTAETENRFDCILAELENEKKKCEAMKVSLASIKSKIKCNEEDKFQKFVIVTKAKDMAKQVIRCIQGAPVLDENICLNVDRNLRSMLQKMDTLGTFGKRKFGVMQPDSLLRVGKRQKFCIKIDSDEEECRISSACALHDGKFVLCDAGNNKLKLIECGTFAVKGHCNLPEEPMQVCQTIMAGLAVTLPFKMQVQFVSEDEMNLTRVIKTDFECCGLAFANGSLYISDRSVFVYIYNLSGRKLKQINIDQPGDQLFRFINSLSVSHDGSRIYIADGYNELIILDGKGTVIKTFNDAHLCEPSGSFVNEEGSLLVCGCSSNNVIQFGRDGELTGEVLKTDDSDTCIQAICCIQSTGQLVIGSNSNDIIVYDLKT